MNVLLRWFTSVKKQTSVMAVFMSESVFLPHNNHAFNGIIVLGSLIGRLSDATHICWCTVRPANSLHGNMTNTDVN